MKRIGIIVVSVAAALGSIVLMMRFATSPPSEAKMIANFKSHRATYERLRDMLTEDSKLLRIADWGIETESGFEKPHEGRFPAARYDEYLALLKEVNAKGASRRRGEPADPCVLVWASGFAADTRHRYVCWLTNEPASQPGFKHIEDRWYIRADW